MSGAAPHDAPGGTTWRIRVGGYADEPWADWYEGLRAERRGSETILVGRLPDQAALFGLLLRLRDLGLELRGVAPVAQRCPRL